MPCDDGTDNTTNKSDEPKLDENKQKEDRSRADESQREEDNHEKYLIKRFIDTLDRLEALEPADDTVMENEYDVNIPQEEKHMLFDDDKVKFYRTERGEVIAVVYTDERQYIVDIDPKDSDHDAWRYFSIKTGKKMIRTEKHIKDALKNIRAVARREAEKIIRYSRIYYEDERIFYNLGDQDVYRYVEISKEGSKIWHKLNMKFECYDGNLKQDDPSEDGSLNLLDKYINLEGDDLFLLKIYLLAAFIPHIQHCILLLLA